MFAIVYIKLNGLFGFYATHSQISTTEAYFKADYSHTVYITELEHNRYVAGLDFQRAK